jgi:cell division protein FtsB
MGFSSYDSGSRYRRQAKQRRRKIIMVLLFLAALSGVSYWWGGENVRSSEVAYKQQAEKLKDERAGLEKQITDLQSEVQSTLVRYQQLESKYMTEVPQGEFRKLTDLVKKRLDAGIKPERLSFLIDAARPPKNCSESTLKRFVVKTPVYNGPHGSVSFGNGIVTVTGEGQASVSAVGQKEAWYDPGKPVKIIFTEIGGKKTVKEGLLPIQHALVSGNKEYRFTVAAGERSFIAVTSDNCDYP